MHISSRRGGYVLLLSILVMGVIASTIVASLLMLGTASNRASFTVQQTAESLSFADACAEYALFALTKSSDYQGGQTLTFPEGTCDILPIGGFGNNDRFVCVEATTSDVVRRIEIIVQQLLPQTKIQSWQEVVGFSLCS